MIEAEAIGRLSTNALEGVGLLKCSTTVSTDLHVTGINRLQRLDTQRTFM